LAIRRSLFTQVGNFRSDLDRSGRRALAAGDTEMADRIKKAGWKILYAPDACVRHLISPERMTKAYIYKIGRGLAESHVILTGDAKPAGFLRRLSSDFLYALRMGIHLVSALLYRKTFWFDDYIRFWIVAIRIPLRVAAVLRRATESSTLR
jgi:GT2 family glycosyltransferase